MVPSRRRAHDDEPPVELSTAFWAILEARQLARVLVERSIRCASLCGRRCGPQCDRAPALAWAPLHAGALLERCSTRSVNIAALAPWPKGYRLRTGFHPRACRAVMLLALIAAHSCPNKRFRGQRNFGLGVNGACKVATLNDGGSPKTRGFAPGTLPTRDPISPLAIVMVGCKARRLGWAKRGWVSTGTACCAA